MQTPLREYKLQDAEGDFAPSGGQRRTPRNQQPGHENNSPSPQPVFLQPQYLLPPPPMPAVLAPYTPPPQQQLASVAPHGLGAPPQPASFTFTLPREPQVDPDALAHSFLEVQALQEQWELVSSCRDPAEQVRGRLRALVQETTRVASRAAQAPQSSALLLNLLEGRAAEVLEARGEEQLGQRLAELQGVLARQAASQGHSLISNIVSNTSRQALAGGQQLVKASALNAPKTSQRVDARAHAASRSLAWVRQHQEGLRGALLLGGALLATRFLGHLLAPSPVPGAGALLGRGRAGARWGRGGRQWAQAEALDRRRHQCEAANAQAREYARELGEQRFNPFYRRAPPQDTCPLPPDNLPWRPHRHEQFL